MFLLDTNVISDAQKPKPPLALELWLQSQAEIAIPFPAVLEMEQGIAEIRKTKPQKADELRAWLDSVLAGRHYYPAITVEVARLLAEMYCCRPLKNLWYSIPDSKKERKPGQDLFIAAIAIVHSLPLATSNTPDFVQINRYFPMPGVFAPISHEWVVPLPQSLRDMTLNSHQTPARIDHALAGLSPSFG